jgi:uncharacterized protein
MNMVLQLNRAWGPVVDAPVLVMKEGFSPRYDLDRWTGVISRIGHSAEGESIKGRILLIPTVKGGVAAGWAFFDLLHKGIAPAGFVFGKLNPVMVQGAVLAHLPIAEGWSQAEIATLRNGDLARLDPGSKTLTIHSP